MSETEYIFKKGEGWIPKPVFVLEPGMCWRGDKHDMSGDEVCPRCKTSYNHHSWWDCPNPDGRWGPSQWPQGPEDL